MTKRTELTKRELPPYLGFGTLDPASMDKSNGVGGADYKTGDEMVYRVRFGPDRVELVEFFAGQELSHSVGETLSQCFFYHMMAVSDSEHPRLRGLFDKIARSGNVYIRLPGEKKLITYPAGYMFGLRLPITRANQPARKTIVERLQARGDPLLLGFVHEVPGTMLKLEADGNVIQQEVTVADFSTILLKLNEAAALFFDTGSVLAEKEYRLAIMPVQDLAPGQMSIHPGDKERGFLTFTVLPLSPERAEQKGLVEKFRSVSARVIEAQSEDDIDSV